MNEFKSHSLTRQELLFGLLWLPFEAVLFAPLLQALNTLLPAPLPQTVVNLLFFSINFIVVAILFRRYLLEQLRLIPDTAGGAIGIAVVGFAAYLFLNFLITQLLLTLDPDFFSINDVTIRQLAREDYPLMFFGTVILVPITEECLFRGLLFRGLYDRSPVLAWIISVVLFSAVHILSYVGAYPFHRILLCLIQHIPAGVCLAAAYRLSGSLLSPILIHALVNLVGMVSLR